MKTERWEEVKKQNQRLKDDITKLNAEKLLLLSEIKGLNTKVSCLEQEQKEIKEILGCFDDDD